MVKLVAVDLDGTFLNNRRDVSKENREMVKKLQSMGVKFITNSGRTYEGVRHVLDGSQIECESICMNGAAVYNKEGKIVKACFMKKEDVLAIASRIGEEDYFIEYNTDAGTCVTVSPDEAEASIRGWMSLYNNGNTGMITKEEMDRDLKRIKADFIYIDKVEDIFERGYQVFKIAISHVDTEKIKRIREELSQNSNIAVSASFHTNVEITDKSADKGLALEQYAKENNILMEEVVAFGDSLNDYSMLKRNFGYTVAMKNAMEEIKKVAKYQTRTNDEHGVSHFVNRVISGENLCNA
ncbi:HAD family hydrolase [Konateibacter massiliensis]|uniref:HAD family hydrolase n=1 Tax=Konateibacter massiliensis TaxID=2002841 RepID=UPI000C1553C7|nr:HAD family hydrolase [Konateibacter massiliensis]